MAGIVNKFKFLLVIAAALNCFVVALRAEADPIEQTKHIPIQYDGRVQSFDSFSRETVSLITGRQSWDGKSAQTLIFEALNSLDSVDQLQWIKISHRPLIDHLSLPKEQKFYALKEVLKSIDKIEGLVRSSQSKRDKDLRPSKLEQKAELLYSQIMAVRRLASGKNIEVIPGSGETAWRSPYLGENLLSSKFKTLVRLAVEGPPEEAESEISKWLDEVHKTTNEQFRRMADLEVHYHDVRPFRLAWIAYMLAFLMICVSKRFSLFLKLGIVAFVHAAVFHSYGIGLRVLILNRPPVSNMYESMVFMNWSLVIFACIFSLIRKNVTVLSAGSLISALVMIYSSMLPIDSGMSVLAPVLRSSYWLITHVLTIVASYGAFGLAMGMGHGHLIADALGKFTAESERDSAQLIYRVIQLGILLLGLGTVLGGVWANESWGRFWGWDPKETWALITFLGYLLIVHLKYQRTINHFWLAVSSVIGFLLVIMTWFGVNFLLGRGLHSYGSVSGGLIWIIYYLIFEVVFFGFIFVKKKCQTAVS